eukprot:2664429-Prymnesium_polylepis.1
MHHANARGTHAPFDTTHRLLTPRTSANVRPQTPRQRTRSAPAPLSSDICKSPVPHSKHAQQPNACALLWPAATLWRSTCVKPVAAPISHRPRSRSRGIPRLPDTPRPRKATSLHKTSRTASVPPEHAHTSPRIAAEIPPLPQGGQAGGAARPPKGPAHSCAAVGSRATRSARGGSSHSGGASERGGELLELVEGDDAVVVDVKPAKELHAARVA